MVEARAAALREAGDVIQAIAAGLERGLAENHRLSSCEVESSDAERPRLFKSTGMAWEDAVVAGGAGRARGCLG